MPCEDYDILESKFYIALGRFMQNFAFLDLNIGLCIRFLANQNDPSVINPFLEKLTTHQKIDVLKDIISYKFTKENTEIIEDFKKWYDKAIKAKSLRNTYIHGLWELVPRIPETPIRLTTTSRFADLDNYQLMSFDEFETNVNEMANVFNTYCEFRKKYNI